MAWWYYLLSLRRMFSLSSGVRRNGGPRKRTVPPTDINANNTDVTDIPPERRTYMDWSRISDSGLRAACFEACLVDTGSHQDLVNRLFIFYQQQPLQPTSAIPAPVVDVPPVNNV